MLENVMYWLGLEDAGSVIQPRFEFQFWLDTSSALFLMFALGCFTLLFYSKRLRTLPVAHKVYLLISRTVIVVLAMFLAMNPIITGYLAEPGDQYVLMLFDDSASMQIAGRGAQSRGEVFLSRYEAERERFEERLKDRYRVMKYAFGESLERVKDEIKLRFRQPESKITAALYQALNDMSGMNIAAVVLFSDGQEQGSTDEYSVSQLDSYPVRVYTVGTGEELEWSDLSVQRVSFSRSDFDKNPVIANVDIRASGLAGETAVVEIIDGNKVVEAKELPVTVDALNESVQFEFIPDRKDWITYRARVRLKKNTSTLTRAAVKDIQVAGQDFVTQNNEMSFLVDASEKKYRVLYVTGRPNWENKFIRQALLEDSEFKITSLIRISAAETTFVYKGRDTNLTNTLFDGFEQDQEKYNRYDESVFLRLGAEEHELVKGFPTDPEELFNYDCVLFGDIEPSDFSTRQLELTKEFVEKRGGVLLLLGGDRSFLTGKDSVGILSGLIPVIPDPSNSISQRRDPTAYYLKATLEGELSGTLSLSSNSDENQFLWQQMPPLFGVNVLRLKSVSADILAAAEPETPGKPDLPLLVSQRYGRGKCAVFSVADTWQWQMQKDLDDPYHERLWRQIMRYLVNDVPLPVTLRKEDRQIVQGKTIALDVLVQDKKYETLEGAQLDVTLESPSKVEESLPVDESILEAGLYQTEWKANETGMYRIKVQAADPDQKGVAEHEEAVLVHSDMREFEQSQFNPGLLQDIARRTGGRYYSMQQFTRLVDDLPWNPNENAKQKTVHLWHHPFFAIFFFLLLSIEWLLRRRKGLA